MKTFFYSLATIATIPFIIGCATVASDRKIEGYGVQINQSGAIRTSLYNGPLKITNEKAMKYSMLGAMENCAQEKKYALMDKPVDRTPISSLKQVTANGFVRTLDTPPQYSTAFICKSNINSIGHFEKTENVSRDIVNPITKDLSGGILIRTQDQKEENSFKDKDILLSLNDKRIEEMSDLSNIRDTLPPGKAKAKIIRNSKVKIIEITVTPQTVAIHNAQAVMFGVTCAAKDQVFELVPMSLKAACDTVHLFLKGQEIALAGSTEPNSKN
ncbi:MAG: hypothetical protein H7256_09095 [Bdellovibrio sp.]|nr:hypothetical protein [Bdellovibrio sp.]